MEHENYREIRTSRNPNLRQRGCKEKRGTSTSGHFRNGFYLRFGKRALDVAGATLGLLLSAPIVLLSAVAIRLDSRGPTFFRQRRIGRRGKPFNIIKLRTMVYQTKQNGLRITADGDDRKTAVGKWLRRLKVDELPQLFNVLKGDMTLVGPRPEVPEYVAVFDAQQQRVLDLKPGLTGPASLAFVDEEKVLGRAPDKEAFYRNTLMPQKVELDLAYSEHVNFLTDLQLIFATLGKLFDSGNGGSQASPLPPRTIHLRQGSELGLESQNGRYSLYRS